MSPRAGFVRLPLVGAVALIGCVALGAGCAASRAPAVSEPASSPPPPCGRSGASRLLRDDTDPASLRAAVAESLAWLATQPGDRVFVAGPRRVTVAEQTRALRDLLGVLSEAPGPERLATYVREAFELLEAAGGPEGQMLVTGYYEPVIEASERPSADYGVPVLGLPDDLVEVRLEAFDSRYRGERLFGRVEGRRLVPYWRRADIDAGRLAGRGLELAWARDPVDVFFMEIQGSGTLRFPDGRERRVGYAGANGRAYRSHRRLLIDEGHVPREAMSMQAIREWLRATRASGSACSSTTSPTSSSARCRDRRAGSLGRPLTPGRSVATDARLFPPGALAFLDTERPEQATGTAACRWVPLARFVLNQDTGGAIRGAGRVDFFWGRGDAAAFAAGLMRQPGRLYFLVPRPAATAATGPAYRSAGSPTP